MRFGRLALGLTALVGIATAAEVPMDARTREALKYFREQMPSSPFPPGLAVAVGPGACENWMVLTVGALPVRVQMNLGTSNRVASLDVSLPSPCFMCPANPPLQTKRPDRAL